MRAGIVSCGVAAMLLAFAGTASAGSAGVSIIGFSPDGATFAYEQFGLEPLGQFPYSDLQIVETATGKPVPGSPFRVAMNKPAKTPTLVRQMAYNAADRTIRRLGIGEKGTVLAQASGDYADKAAVATPVSIEGLGAGILTIANEKVPTKECAKLKVDPARLQIDVVRPDGTVLRRLVQEKKVPPERFCPFGYGLVELRAFPRADKPPVLAIVLARTVPGIDGPETAYQAHVVDLAGETIALEEQAR